MMDQQKAPSVKGKGPQNGSEVGQGYNDARGEIPDKKDTPKYNGQNLDNDPAHQKEKEDAA